VTPEHALTEHASWILIHQRSLPLLAPLRHARPACKCPFVVTGHAADVPTSTRMTRLGHHPSGTPARRKPLK
jgi:hypothetical protein